MSQVIIEMARAGLGGLNIMAAKGGVAEEITSSGTSQATTITAEEGFSCTVINNGTDSIWVAFGSAPTAAVEADHLVPPNQSRDFCGLSYGDKIAVINDS